MVLVSDDSELSTHVSEDSTSAATNTSTTQHVVYSDTSLYTNDAPCANNAVHQQLKISTKQAESKKAVQQTDEPTTQKILLKKRCYNHRHYHQDA